MAAIYRYALHALLILRYYFHNLTRTGSFGPGQAACFIPGSNEKNGTTLRAGLFRHHVKQFHESSCSVATVVSTINTLAERNQAAARPITQQEILDRVRAAHWKERMGPNGHKGRRGLPIHILGQVVQASLAAYDIPHARVEVIQALSGKRARVARARIMACLNEFQTQDNCLIIAHFDQGSFVKEMNIPHISPVGGFDPNTGRVTILDVDPSQPQPYTLPFSRFYRGISTAYGGLFAHFGYGRGGIIVIHI